MLKTIALLLLALPVSSLGAADPPAAFGPWKAVGKVKVPAPLQIQGMLITDDKRNVVAFCMEKMPWNSGGPTTGFVEVYTIRCFAVATGKETVNTGMSRSMQRMSLRGNRLAVTDMSDKVTVYDIDAGKKISMIDPRSANDSPPGNDKGVAPVMRDTSSGRLNDIEFGPDAKVLLTMRRENTPWKKHAKGTAMTSASFDRVVFWDADKRTALAVLDCEDKQLFNGHLTLLPTRNQMLAKFSNGLRIIDLSSKKWGNSFAMKDIWNAAVSADEKMIAVTTARDQSVKVLDIDGFKQLATFKEQPIDKTPRDDGSLTPTGYEFGPSAFFVDGDKALRVVLNNQKTVIYRDVKTGAKIKAPASEAALKFPGGAVRVLAVSQDRRCAVTATVQGGQNCTVWQRGIVEKK